MTGPASPAIATGKANVFFLGNCQVNKLSLMTKLDNPALRVSFQTITEHWGTYTPDAAEAAIRAADIVVCQLVLSPGYRFAHRAVREMARGPVVFTPYVYIDGFGALEVVSSKGVNRIQAMDLLTPAFTTRPRGQVIQQMVKGEIDLKVAERLRRSIDEMRGREAEGADIRIADFIEAVHRDAPVAYAINHPTPVVLDEMFRRLAEHLGLRRTAYADRPHHDRGRLHLPRANRVFSPFVAEALGLTHPPEEHWYSSTVKLTEMAWKRMKLRGDPVLD